MAARGARGRHGETDRRRSGLDKNGIQQDMAPVLGAAGRVRRGVIQHGFRPEAA